MTAAVPVFPATSHGPRLRGPSLAALVVAGLTIGAAGTTLALDVDTTSYSNRKLGIRLAVPEGWTLTRQTGYPSMLLLATPLPKAGKKTAKLRPRALATVALSHGSLGVRGTLGRYVGEMKKGLLGVGLRVKSVKPGRVLTVRGLVLDALSKDGKTAVRQLYHQHGRRVLIWTLRCRAAQLKRLTRELERFIDGLDLRSK